MACGRGQWSSHARLQPRVQPTLQPRLQGRANHSPASSILLSNLHSWCASHSRFAGNPEEPTVVAGVSSTELNKLSISFVRPNADSAQVRLAQPRVQRAGGSAMLLLCPAKLSA